MENLYMKNTAHLYYIKDHLGSNRMVVKLNSGIQQVQHYYPFGLSFAEATNRSYQPYKYNGKELVSDEGLNWYDYLARTYDPALLIFTTMDPMAEKYYSISPYAYCANNPVNAIDPTGMDSIHVLDQGTRPLDNGTAGQAYTATIYVTQNGVINGPYSGSSYPNSISNTNNNTKANTVNEGEHQYNNASGHKGGTQQGLNLVDANGNRNSPGTDPNGNSVTMTYVNVHEGASDNGNATSRGSLGCITINPSDATTFFGNFDRSGSSGNIGTSTGSVIIERGGNVELTKTMLHEKQRWQQNPLTPIPTPAMKPLIIIRQ